MWMDVASLVRASLVRYATQAAQTNIESAIHSEHQKRASITDISKRDRNA